VAECVNPGCRNSHRGGHSREPSAEPGGGKGDHRTELDGGGAVVDRKKNQASMGGGVTVDDGRMGKPTARI
jgi:hypothetical protein